MCWPMQTISFKWRSSWIAARFCGYFRLKLGTSHTDEHRRRSSRSKVRGRKVQFSVRQMQIFDRAD